MTKQLSEHPQDFGWGGKAAVLNKVIVSIDMLAENYIWTETNKRLERFDFEQAETYISRAKFQWKGTPNDRGFYKLDEYRLFTTALIKRQDNLNLNVEAKVIEDLNFKIHSLQTKQHFQWIRTKFHLILGFIRKF